MGISNSILKGGQISVINNAELSLFISSFEDRIKDLTESEVRLITNNDNHLRQQVQKYIRILSVKANVGGVKSDESLKSKFKSDIIGFFDDAILENMFIEAYYTQLNAIEEQVEMLKYLEAILSVVNSDLLRIN